MRNIREMRERLERLDKEELIRLLHIFMMDKELTLEKYDIYVEYWTDKDKEILKEFSKEELLEMVYGLVLIIPYINESMCAADCPFCILVWGDCIICPYGRRKGVCIVKGSAFSMYREACIKKDESCKKELEEAMRDAELNWVNTIINGI